MLKNVACPGCGNVVSFTIDSDEEVTDISSRRGVSNEISKKCGSCRERVTITVN